MSNALTTQQAGDQLPVTMGFGDMASFEFLQRTAKAFSSSTMVPAAYQSRMQKGYGENATWEDNPAALPNCMIALDMSQRLRANPLMVMQNLHIIEGRPSWSSQFIIAAINSCGRFSPLRFELKWLAEIDATYSTFEWVTGGNGRRAKQEKKHEVRIKDARCVAWTVERGTAIPQFSLDDMKTHGSIYGCCKHYGIPILESPPVTMEMAVNEGWYGKNGSKWRSMPDLMLQYRTAAFFGRIYAPELLMGLPTAEEVQDVFVQGADGTLQHAGQHAVPPTTGTVEVVQPEWSADQWAERLPQILDGIAKGKTIEDALAWLGSKAKVTNEQEKELREKVAQLQQPAAAPAATPDGPEVSPDKLAADMQACADLDKLYELGGLLEAITDEAQRLRVNEIFDARVAQLEKS